MQLAHQLYLLPARSKLLTRVIPTSIRQHRVIAATSTSSARPLRLPFSTTTAAMSPQDKELKPTPKLSDSIMALFSLKGKVSLITGASGGIGYQVARAYAEAGSCVAMLYNSHNIDKEAADLEKEFGVKVKAYQCDLTDSKAVDDTFKAVKQEFQNLDIVVANAGGLGIGPVNEMDDAAWEKCLNVNYSSVFKCARAAGRIFEEQVKGGRDFGRFIITSSISASIVNVPSSQVAYNASKAAVLHMGKSLAYDWREFARVNVVSPGFMDTAMGGQDKEALDVIRYKTVLARQGDPKELKGAYLYFASDASSYTTGAELIVDGGYVLA